jgi:hypothetical protein
LWADATVQREQLGRPAHSGGLVGWPTDEGALARLNGIAAPAQASSPRPGAAKENAMYIGGGTILLIIVLYLLFR